MAECRLGSWHTAGYGVGIEPEEGERSVAELAEPPPPHLRQGRRLPNWEAPKVDGFT